MDPDSDLLDIGMKLQAEKYLMNCAEFDNSDHTIHMEVCVHDKDNVAIERLFDALEKMVNTDLQLKVGFSKGTRFGVGKSVKTKAMAQKNVFVLSSCRSKVDPPRPADQLLGGDITLYDTAVVDRSITSAPSDSGSYNRPGHEEVRHVHAQATDDTVPNRTSLSEASDFNEQDQRSSMQPLENEVTMEDSVSRMRITPQNINAIPSANLPSSQRTFQVRLISLKKTC